MAEKIDIHGQMAANNEAQLMIQRVAVALGVNGWNKAEIERVLCGLHAVGVTLEWLEKNEAKIKERAAK